MKGLLKYLSPFAPDQSGVVSVLFELGGITVICDAGGCTGNICGFDEPRWFRQKSALFSAGLRDMDAILGQDDKLIAKLKDTADKVNAKFAALVGTPVPAVIATDYRALERMANKRCDIPAIAIPCTGTRLYDEGEEDTYMKLLATFATGKENCQEKNEGKILGVWGMTPLDISMMEGDVELKGHLAKEGYDEIYTYGMGSDLSQLERATLVSKNLVVSPAGLKPARYLQEKYNIPYEVAYPLLPADLTKKLHFEKTKKVLIIHQQVAANEIRHEILANKADCEVIVASFFGMDSKLRQEGDIHLNTENEMIELVLQGGYDVVIGDGIFRRALGNFTGEFIEFSHFAVSGTLLEEEKTQIARVYGVVQGVGFRPFVSRIGDKYGIKGSVANKGSYVEIYLQGFPRARENFLKELADNPPERSAVLKIDVTETKNQEFSSFDIIESEKEGGDIFVSPDIATCPKCKEELYDPENRRYMHPFINCTACGPRVTILDAMPYDRERTSMGEFPMCPQCEEEYTHAETRRYDAQPVCCNDCGPKVYLLDSKSGQAVSHGETAISAARQAIVDGKIVAVKGIGGFHLCCDATNEAAVTRLRQMKNRPKKPFAVMMKNRQTVEQECVVRPEQEEVLDGHQKPIILLKARKETRLAPSVAPDNPKIGVMLPYAPVQMLLFDYKDNIVMTTDCFVMTSGNVSGAPICRSDEDVLTQIASFCDVILSHNRKIRLRADDSVMDYYKGKPYMIRRSRGYAPLPIMMSEKFQGDVLAVGGELKNTFCLGKNQLFYPSPFVGDMEDLRTVKALEESIQRMKELLECEPKVIACDMHPKYNTTQVAQYLGGQKGIPVIPVQHHYAHVVSCMAENDYSSPVIGVSFDGTGYGLDGTIWGGEIMIADLDGFQRMSHIKPFVQIGGDASAKEGWRIAVSLINDLYGKEASTICDKLNLCDENTRVLYQNMSRRHINAVESTSAGRLFDGVSAILGICLASSFESEASTSLEFAAQYYEEFGATEETSSDIMSFDGFEKKDDSLILPTDLLVRTVVEGRLAGIETGKLAYEFHLGLARQIVAACETIAKETEIHTVALSGGVFQNQLLLKLCDDGLKKVGLMVLRHSLIPPNDGGIALGQAVVVARKINRKR